MSHSRTADPRTSAFPRLVESFLAATLAGCGARDEDARASGSAPGLDTGPPLLLTYSADAAPILQRRCQVCHRPESVGPFSLLTYEDVRSRARMIASVIEDEIMPPWSPDHRFDGLFLNERKLRPGEKETLLRWIACGLPRGDPAEDPAPVVWPEGWSIGEPDVEIAAEYDWLTGEKLPPEGYHVPPEGSVDYAYFAVKTDFPEDRWMAALEVRPSALDVVHHALVIAQIADEDSAESSFLSVYQPGNLPYAFHEGCARRLPKGATLVFQMHYTPNGKRRIDRPRLGIVFADGPPRREVRSIGVFDREFVIPPGASHHEVKHSRILPRDTQLVSFTPHMHWRGKLFRYVAFLPDGGQRELLSVDYDFNWQESYVLAEPLLLPAGTRLECTAVYDNSAGNPNNPDPEATVRWGQKSSDEMFIGFYDWLVPLE